MALIRTYNRNSIATWEIEFYSKNGMARQLKRLLELYRDKLNRANIPATLSADDPTRYILQVTVAGVWNPLKYQQMLVETYEDIVELCLYEPTARREEPPPKAA